MGVNDQSSTCDLKLKLLKHSCCYNKIGITDPVKSTWDGGTRGGARLLCTKIKKKFNAASTQ